TEAAHAAGEAAKAGESVTTLDGRRAAVAERRELAERVVQLENQLNGLAPAPQGADLPRLLMQARTGLAEGVDRQLEQLAADHNEVQIVLTQVTGPQRERYLAELAGIRSQTDQIQKELQTGDISQRLRGLTENLANIDKQLGMANKNKDYWQ